MRLALAAGIILAAAPGAAEAQDENVMIVYDVSGSMWGQIDGENKVVIARDVLGDLLRDWSPDRNLGMIAYGHRREGDCGDIEQVIDLGPPDLERTIATVNALTPRGRTPLADSVRMAAETLRFEEAPATVILLTDGLETCNADPCALAEDLAASGVNFVAHVIGFDVAEADQPQISCIAEATGGQFLPADNAAELAAALTQVAAAPAPEPTLPDSLTFRAIDTRTGSVLRGVDWVITDQGGRTVYTGISGGESLMIGLEEGVFTVDASREGYEGSASISVEPGAANNFDVFLDLALPSLILTAVDSESGAPLRGVNWSFLNLTTEHHSTAVSGAETFNALLQPGRYLVEAERQGATGRIEVLLDEIDVYERQIVLSAPMSEAIITAPAEIPAGSAFVVEWTGPDDEQDYVTIVEAGAPEGSYNDYWRTSRGDPATLIAPDALGSYEIRYVHQQSGQTLATRPVTLTPVSATIEAPMEIPAGSVVEIAWEGPDNPGDYITIVETGAPEGSYTDYWRTDRGTPAQLIVPDALGNHEVRYVIQRSGRTLSSQAVRLTPVSADLILPAPIVLGGRFQILWEGPDNPGDYITIVEAGAPEGSYTDYWRTDRGTPATLAAPDSEGAYELRYVIQRSGRTLTALPVTIGVPAVTLEVPEAVSPGGVVEVLWHGPGRFEDFIQIVPEGSASDAPALRESRASQGSPLQIFAPAQPGMYELRYRASDSGEVLARIPLPIGVAETAAE